MSGLGVRCLLEASPKRRRGPRQAVAAILVVLAFGAVGAMPAAARSPARIAQADAAYSTTLNYVIRFAPRWISWWLQSRAPENRMLRVINPPRANGTIGPNVNPIAAPNIDTVYGTALNVNLSNGPVIFSIPATRVQWSLLTLTVWQSVFQTSIPVTFPKPKTVYGLVLPGWRGVLPPGVTKVVVPYPQTLFLVRANRYTHNVNTVSQAIDFVRAIQFTPLADYRANPNGGRAIPVPQVVLAASSRADQIATLRDAPTKYLRILQVAMHSPTTQPLSASDVQLSSAFDAVFAAAQQAATMGDYGPLDDIATAAQRAYALIVDRYMGHTVGDSEWIHFQKLADFGTDYLDRAAGEDFIPLGNSAATTVYWDAFVDDRGSELHTGGSTGYPFYRMTFSKAQIPQNNRFWSVTLYVGDQLGQFAPNWPAVPTKHVASYTPGLVTNRDGSITIFIQPNPPANPALRPNWLPTPAEGPFSVLLRVYSPIGNTASPDYVPPDIKPLGIL